MSKDRSPEEILKDKRTTLEKVRDELKSDLQVADKALKQFIAKSKSKNRGNPKEAGASIEITEVKPIGESTRPRRPSPRGKLTMAKGGGLMEATAKLKAKGMKEGGMVVKEKVVAIDKSPNSGLITQRGFGAGRRT